MALILVGFNHRTAPVDMRERLSISAVDLPAILSELHERYLLNTERTYGSEAQTLATCESAILSTCNRLEVYAVVQDVERGWNTIETILAQKGALSRENLHEHLYLLAGHPVVEHLMHVTAGLDSMILGEPQIMGQVSEAFTRAQEARTSGTVLSHLFSAALHAGKRAHTETSISRYTTSVSHAAVQLVQKDIPDIQRARILLIGAGETASLAAKALKMHNARHITCINRTQGRAEALAEQIQGQALPWQAISEALAEADVVLSTTSSPVPILTFEMISRCMARREGRSLAMVDLAVPRDIETTVAGLPGIRLYNIDHLQSVLDMNLTQRKAALPAVEAILKEESEVFLSWLHSRQVVPILTGFRKKISALADEEVQQALNRMDGLNQRSQQAVMRMAHRIVNKMLHEPTERLKAHAASGESRIYVQAIQDLFDLDASLTRTEQVDCPCANL
jgi:glutamyl-tRNA reductase